jgi:lysozyme
MTYSKTGLELTKHFEGCRLHAYEDEGAYSIGYGHRGVAPDAICTQAQADAWLAEDIQFAADFIDKHVTITLSQPQFDALVDFVFNVGVGNFEHSTLLKLLNAGKLKEAADEFPRWNKASGKILDALSERRKDEQTEFNS